MSAVSYARLLGLVGAVVLAGGIAMGGAPVGPSADDWPVYGHDTSSSRSAPLTDIPRENVSRLKVAWTYHTGDLSDGKGQRRRSGFETTPIVVDGTLYLTTGFNRVIALDPARGAERGSYDPRTVLNAAYGDGLINRGVATWLDSTRGTTSPCRRRGLAGTLDGPHLARDGRTRPH